MSMIQNLKTKKTRRRRRKTQWRGFSRPFVFLIKLCTVMALMCVALVGWLVLNKHTAEEYLHYNNQMKSLEREEKFLRQRVSHMQERFESLSTDSFEIERNARENHLMMKPDEQVIIFTPRRPAPRSE